MLLSICNHRKFYDSNDNLMMWTAQRIFVCIDASSRQLSITHFSPQKISSKINEKLIKFQLSLQPFPRHLIPWKAEKTLEKILATPLLMSSNWKRRKCKFMSCGFCPAAALLFLHHQEHCASRRNSRAKSLVIIINVPIQVAQQCT